MLRVTNMSVAILCVYLDSASDLPQARSQSKPDPFVTLTVGKKSEQTSAVRRTDAPVWEQGFTFLVANPENDSLQLKLTDQKTEKDLGVFSYTLRTLIDKTGMEVVAQPFQLQKSGPTSKITMSLVLKVLKRAPTIEADAVFQNKTNAEDVPLIAATSTALDTTSSSGSSVPLAEFSQEAIETLDSGAHVNVAANEEIASASIRKPFLSSSSFTSSNGSTGDVSTNGNQLTQRHRTTSTTSTSSQFNLGKIQTTLRYSVQRQRLTVVIHRVA